MQIAFGLVFFAFVLRSLLFVLRLSLFALRALLSALRLFALRASLCSICRAPLASCHSLLVWCLGRWALRRFSPPPFPPLARRPLLIYPPHSLFSPFAFCFFCSPPLSACALRLFLPIRRLALRSAPRSPDVPLCPGCLLKQRTQKKRKTKRQLSKEDKSRNWS